MIGAIPVIAENRIREAIERGEFENLERNGQPLDLDGAYDPDWWIKRKIKHERLTPDELVVLVERLQAMR